MLHILPGFRICMFISSKRIWFKMKTSSTSHQITGSIEKPLIQNFEIKFAENITEHLNISEIDFSEVHGCIKLVYIQLNNINLGFNLMR